MSATVQQVLELSTKSPSLRADVCGWAREDPRCVVPDKPISHSTYWREGEPTPKYECILKALADGWKLLAPPEGVELRASGVRGWTEWSWMLVREVAPMSAWLILTGDDGEIIRAESSAVTGVELVPLTCGPADGWSVIISKHSGRSGVAYANKADAEREYRAALALCKGAS